MPLNTHDPNVAWTVSELNTYVRDIMRENMNVPVWVQGALTRFSFSRGCAYTTIKDERGAQLKLVYFGGQSVFERLQLKIGDVIMACGMIDLFVQGGEYQLNVHQIVPLNSTGALMQQFLDLREKLQKEGLFDPARKKRLPVAPACVCVITSLDVGKAAVHDFLKTAYLRNPTLHVRLVGTKVQGPGTAENIVRILQFLNDRNACDVIVITRGGGSMEDLWEFNNEALARAVAASRIPVVTAIGHQIDNTICDYVADASAITPTDAANKVTEGMVRLTESLTILGRRLINHMALLTAGLRARLARAAQSAYLTRPLLLYSEHKQHLDRLALRLTTLLPQRAASQRLRLDALSPRLIAAIRNVMAHCHNDCDRASRLLQSLDPKGVLQRGYAILLDEQKHAVRSREDVASGQHLTAVLARDTLKVTVE